MTGEPDSISTELFRILSAEPGAGSSGALTPILISFTGQPDMLAFLRTVPTATSRLELERLAAAYWGMHPVRAAEAADAAAIADLVTQLGYPATADDVVTRLERMNEFPAIALVAEHDRRVVGIVMGHVFPSIHSTEPVAWLTTLAVDGEHQQKGIGRQLCAAIERWARGYGATRVSVTSGRHRDGAHAFYEKLGYDRTGVRLTKHLG